MRDELIEAWRTNNRINLFMIDDFVAHESHHRGNILLTLKECGHNLDKDSRYGIWGWDQI